MALESFQCAGDNTAYLDITVNGFMAGNIKELLTTTLDLQLATLYVCNDRSCRATTTNNVTITPQGDDSNGSDNHSISITAIIVCLCVLTLVVIFLIIALLFNRYVLECHICTLMSHIYSSHMHLAFH